jgi:dsDNA-specific endonuclease/ATPase MutS2
MAFPVGSTVVVLSLGRKRGVVVEAGRGGRYRVQIDNTTVSCREGELAAAQDKETSKRKRARGPRDGEEATSSEAPAAGRIDLHGLTVDEAIARVVDEIDKAVRRGADCIEVVHGKGSGRIRNALHRELAALSVVASFRVDPRNAGVTWVYL